MKATAWAENTDGHGCVFCNSKHELDKYHDLARLSADMQLYNRWLYQVKLRGRRPPPRTRKS